MIIGTTFLESVNYGYHKGIYITEIKSREEAFNIRLHLNRIMANKNILGDVMISDNSDDFEIQIDIRVYGIRNPDDLKYCKEKFEWVK